MFAIIGCPRSGTKYTAMVLRKLGYDVGHEEWGDGGMVGWRFPTEKLTGVTLHQVRDPLATIGSLTTIADYSWKYISRYAPVELPWALDRRCAETWLYWNRMAETAAGWTYRVESLPEIWDEWCNNLGVEGDYKKIKSIPKDTHHRNHASWTWERVYRATPLADEIRNLAEEYGYL